MRKTYITTMPDKPGSFLLASKILADSNLNVTRVSFNKAIDCTMLFIDVSGEKKNIDKATLELEKIGYLSSKTTNSNVILLEFKLIDQPGMLVKILEVISRYNFNISYIDSIENGSDHQNFRMGLYIDNADTLRKFIDETSAICEVKVVNYSKTEKNLDNTVFYLSFANDISTKLNLSHEETNELITNSNLIMQILDEKNESPYKTFEFIGKFADALYSYSGANFRPLISTKELSNDIKLYLIEPPCGSNTYIIENHNNLLFIDGGYNRYNAEMLDIFKSLFTNFDSMHKEIVLTHADIDHCGLLEYFDIVNVNKTIFDNFKAEADGEINFREKNILHAPYCKIGSIMSNYRTPNLDKLNIIGTIPVDNSIPLTKIGTCELCGLSFELYEGNGGHVNGELMLINREFKLAFSGDIYVNLTGFTKEQNEYNKLAPYLMSSVNMDSKKATQTRVAFFKLLEDDNWLICGGHGHYIELSEIKKKS